MRGALAVFVQRAAVTFETRRWFESSRRDNFVVPPKPTKKSKNKKRSAEVKQQNQKINNPPFDRSSSSIAIMGVQHWCYATDDGSKQSQNSLQVRYSYARMNERLSVRRLVFDIMNYSSVSMTRLLLGITIELRCHY